MEFTSETIRDVYRYVKGRLRKKYWRWFRRLHWSSGQADDFMEEVCVDGLMMVRKTPEAWDPERGGLNHWCWLKAKTIARDRLLKAERRSSLHDSLVAEGVTMSYDPIEELLNKESLASACDTLSPDQKEAVGLYYLYGASAHQIARKLGCELKTVYTILDRARKRLKTYFHEVFKLEKTWARHGCSLPLPTDHEEQGPARSPPKRADIPPPDRPYPRRAL